MTVRNSAAVCLGLYLESRAGQAGVARCTSVSRPPQPRPEPAPACQHTPSHTPSHLLCHLQHHTCQPVWRRRYSGHQHHHQSPSCQSASTWLASCPTPHSPSSPLLTTNRHTAVIIIFTNFLNSQSSYLIVILKGSFSTFFH